MYRSRVLRCASTGIAGTLAAVWLVAAAGAPNALAATAGTNIGNAAILTSSGATGSLTSTAQDDWWVVYPKTAGGTVQIKVNDTTSTSASCPDIYFSIDGTDGSADVLADQPLGGDTSQDDYVSKPDSDRYYVEVDTYSCGSVTSPITYSLRVVSGGGGTPSNPGTGTNDPAASIGSVHAALLGHTVYNGTVITSANQYWYQLYLPKAAAATVRFEDTTAAGSSPCSDLYVSLDNSDGAALDDQPMGDNSATVFSVANAGLYYVEVAAYSCNGSDGATYSVEPEPASAWSAAPTAKTGTTAAGASIGNVHAALLGDTVYHGTVVTSSNQYWYQIYKSSGKGTVTVRFEDTTVSDGSASCFDIYVSLDNSDGAVLNANPLGDDTAISYTVSDAGLYYLEVEAYSCGGTDGATYSIEANPPASLAAAPPAKVGTTGAGSSLNSVKAPLLGDTVYSGTVVTSTDQYWYRLYKPSGKGAATVRFADTTVSGGSASCYDLYVSLDNSDGVALDATPLADDTAVTYPLTAAGTYYIEISAYSCGGSDGATYSVEPNPASAWAGVPAVTSVSPATGSSHGGTLVTIKGTWLAGVTAVWFGGAKGTKIHIVSATELTVVTPAHAKGAVSVTVTTGAGRSAAGTGSRYTYT